MRETQVRYLGWEEPLEKGMATHPSIPAWRIPKDRGAWWAMVHEGHKESYMTERLQFHFSGCQGLVRGWMQEGSECGNMRNLPNDGNLPCLECIHVNILIEYYIFAKCYYWGNWLNNIQNICIVCELTIIVSFKFFSLFIWWHWVLVHGM